MRKERVEERNYSLLDVVVLRQTEVGEFSMASFVDKDVVRLQEGSTRLGTRGVNREKSFPQKDSKMIRPLRVVMS